VVHSWKVRSLREQGEGVRFERTRAQKNSGGGKKSGGKGGFGEFWTSIFMAPLREASKGWEEWKGSTFAPHRTWTRKNIMCTGEARTYFEIRSFWVLRGKK